MLFNRFSSTADRGARAQCDRCGLYRYRRRLRKQMEFRGDTLAWTGLLVCGHCLDAPDQHQRPIRLPPDPVPVQDPRPDDTAH
jgi:hypothetical protein